MEISGKKIAVWCSCGAASAVAGRLTLEKYGKDNEVIICNTPIAEEDEDNRRFLKDLEIWYGQNIEIVINSKWPNSSAVEVWSKRKYMSGVKGAPCTKELKKDARYEWEMVNKPDWHVLGFTFDEVRRHKLFILSETQNVIPVLIDAKITKKNCYEIIKEAGIELPRIYEMGSPNANCDGCVKATSPTYWNHIRKIKPEVFQQRAIQSRGLGVRLVRYKGKRIFLDELPVDAIGRPMKNMNFECGVFCEVTN